MKVAPGHIHVGRVLFEDDAYLTVEVFKDEEKPIHLDPDGDDTFLTMMFVRHDDDDVNAMCVWTPWEENEA